MSSQSQESLTLSIPDTRDGGGARESLVPAASRYDGVLAATRRACFEFSREEATQALLLVEIEDLARTELKKIGEAIDKCIKSWTLEAYHCDILSKPSHTADPDTPDSFFSRHAGTKPRLILRLTAKVILHKVKKLLSAPRLLEHLISTFDKEDLHSHIKDYIERWDKNIQFETPKGGQKKRQRESRTHQAASKRQLTPELSKENLQQPQILRAAHTSYIRDTSQRGIINPAQALPRIPSLQNLPSLPTTRQVTEQTENLSHHHHAFHPTPISYYQDQQHFQNSTLQTLEEEHQRRGPQVQQHQEAQQQLGLQMQQQQLGLQMQQQQLGLQMQQQQLGRQVLPQQDEQLHYFFDDRADNQWGDDIDYDIFFQ